MKRFTSWLIAGVMVAGFVMVPVAGHAKGKKDRLTLQAQRAGWLLGMFLGEQNAQPNPFVLKVDPDSDAQIKGVRPGDELIRFDGFEASPLSRVFDRGNELRPGKEVQVWFRRGVQTIRVNLAVPKEPGATPSEKPEKEDKAEKSDKKDKEAGNEEQPAEGKKKKKKSPVVIKPIPAPGSN